MRTTPKEYLPLLAPGAQVIVRDEEWLVRSVDVRGVDGHMVKVIGTGELVRDREATFFTELDRIEPLRPENATLRADDSPGFRQSRLFLEALLRKTPLPASDTRISAGHRQLLDEMQYQLRPAQLALEALRPRLLIADAVGLGKTLEVGIILSELMRRGRGDRILVVTPRHILEQFQHELWTRFSIPLVRLDSEGIQRVRQKIPSNRNPFSFYKRVIISIDTLKNPGRYRHHLEGIHWDAVVFDECHNLVNKGALNNELARVVAPNTRALILTSATPHNGDPKSFAHLIELLDPTAIADPQHYDVHHIEHLFIRRHKADPEVSAEVGSDWAERLPPIPVTVTAAPEEDALFDELARTWLRPPSGHPPATGKGAHLFPYTLLKAALSSQPALAETIKNRRASFARRAAESNASFTEAQQREDAALEKLAACNDAIDARSSAKLVQLGATLREIGVGPTSTTRAVIFSERVATLNWLADQLPSLTGLRPEQIRVMHGGKSDIEQQEIVEEFGLEGSPVRVLVTGDIASEGVNLHRQCHHLIHFDLPWSLITLEQRNGRIDRYGQRHSPEIRALLLLPGNDEVRGDVIVLTRLLTKEHHAHLALGEAASIMGLHDVQAEEERIIDALRGASDEQRKAEAFEAAVPDGPAEDSFDILTFLAGGASTQAVATAAPLSLFEDDAAFVREAMFEVFEDPVAELELREEPEHALISLVPPPDLARRLDALPQSYLKEQRIIERLKLTADRAVAEDRLAKARASATSMWPDVGFLSGQHPILDWLIDKVLVRLGRNEAPVIVCAVDQPTFLLQGVYSNATGEPTAVEWLAVDDLAPGRIPSVRPMLAALASAGVGPAMINPSAPLPAADLASWQAMIPEAVAVGREHLAYRREDLVADLEDRMAAYRQRLDAWAARRHELIAAMNKGPHQIHAAKELEKHLASTREHIASLDTVGEPLVRVVALLVGERR